MRALLHNALGSWITTLGLGVPGLIELWIELSAWLDEDPTTILSWEGVALAIGLIIAGLVARDGNKTSEQVKAK